MDKKVELQVINITNSQAQIGAFAMLLGEVDGERQLPIIIGPAEARFIPERSENSPSVDTRFIHYKPHRTRGKLDTCIDL